MADRPRASSRIAKWLTSLALKRAPIVLALGLAVVGGGIYFGSKLSLQTDLSELLPPTALSVIELKKLNQRIGGTGNVTIALSGQPDALRSYVPRLVGFLRQGLGSELLSIKYQKRDVMEYFRRFAAYYVPLSDLEAWNSQLAKVIAGEETRANPAFVSLDDSDPHAAAKKLVAEIKAARKQVGPHNQADGESGLLMTEGGHLAAIFLRPAADSLNLGASGALLDHLREIIAAHPYPGVKLEGFTGSIPSAIVEVHAVARDIVSTALLVIALVGGVVILYFRSLRELLLMSLALVCGAAFAFAFAYLWIGHVNAQTAFLGSIIVGTGINYGIILLARYRELRNAGVPFDRALEDAIDTTLRATSIAAVATGVSFGVLAAGQVESFHQFGWIGGLGILACWVASFTVVPAALVLFDRRRVYKQRPRRRWLAGFCAGLCVRVARAPRAVITGCVILTLLALGATWHRRHDPLQTDFSKLSTKSRFTSGINKLDNRLRKMDTGSSTPAVVATSSRAEANEVCATLLPIAARTHQQFMGRCYTIDSILPSNLPARQKVLVQLRRRLASVPLGKLDPGDHDELSTLKKTLDERPPTAADLPPTLIEPFIERDGSIGKMAFVEPRNDQIGRNLFAFADTLRSIPLASGKVIHSSGEDVVYADLLRAISRDCKRLTLASALLVLLVLLVIMRKAAPFFRVAAALLVGVAWMVGLAALFGEKLNFFNFVALPTTFGIGIDYAINVEERIRLRGAGQLAPALAEIGPPVMLASATTILGYVSLLTADNQALASFGALGILGEATCLCAALVLMPALWSLTRRDPKPRAP